MGQQDREWHRAIVPLRFDGLCAPNSAIGLVATGTATTNATGSGHFVLRVTESGHSHNFVSPTFSYVQGQTVTWSVTCSTHCAVIDERTFRMVFIPTPSTSAASAPNKITIT